MKQGKPSYKQNNSYDSNRFVSTYRVEADQKDIIIKNLKNESDHLKVNENEYYRLNDQYRELQHKYKQLHEEKIGSDRDFKMRHETAVRNISQLRNQIDAIKTELRDKRLEIDDLESGSNGLTQQLEEKTIELQKYRNDYKSSVADNEELAGQKENLNNHTEKLKITLAQIQEEDRLLKEDNDSVIRRLEQLEKYFQQLQIQEKIVREKIQNYENENNELDHSINQVCQHVNELETSVRTAQSDFNDIQTDIAQLGAQNQKYKSELLHIQKSIQNEVLKNNALIKNLKNAEYTQKVRGNQTEDAEKEVEGLRGQVDGLNEVNSRLEEDLRACIAHLENLGLINLKLVQNLQNFSHEDEAVREMINQKKRVEGARARVSEVSGTYRESKYMNETQGSSRRSSYR